jgi:hypothetical protein
MKHWDRPTNSLRRHEICKVFIIWSERAIYDSLQRNMVLIKTSTMKIQGNNVAGEERDNESATKDGIKE